MKKNFFFAVLFTAQLAQAKDHTVVIKNTTPIEKSKSEVYVNEDGINDTITIVPSTETTAILVTITNHKGEIINEEVMPTCTNASIKIETPEDLSFGSIMEIRDEKGVVYREYNF
jgi:hypothetical protein